ncbi:MAG: hypothetical protein RL885_11840 [Planctomycetota bacterium]
MIRLMTLSSLFLLLAAPAAFAHGVADEDCTLCRGEEIVQCLTCEGAKEGRFECLRCDGKGKVDCTACEKGKANCPNLRCRDGAVSWQTRDIKDDQDPCRFCGRQGTVRCQLCTRGSVDCSDCRGRRKRTGPCFDCAATGVLPCPACAKRPTQSSCLWCNGEEKDCPKLGVGHRSLQDCPKCRGDEKTICKSCKGQTRVPCLRCGATGKMRSATVTIGSGNISKSGVRDHEPCGARGVLPCDECDGGRVACKGCEGGHVMTCSICEGEDKFRCHACRLAPYRSHTVSGKILQAASRFEEAIAYHEAALRVANEHFAAEEQRIEAGILKSLLDELEGKPNADKKKAELQILFKLLEGPALEQMNESFKEKQGKILERERKTTLRELESNLDKARRAAGG